MSNTVVPFPASLGEVLASGDAAVTNPDVARTRACITVAQALEAEERHALEQSMADHFPLTSALTAAGRKEFRASLGACDGLEGACVADHSDPLFAAEEGRCHGVEVSMPDRYGIDFPTAQLVQWWDDVPIVNVGQDTPELDLAGVDQLLADLRVYESRLVSLRNQLAQLVDGGDR